MGNSVTGKVWLTHMLLAVPVWVVMSITVIATFGVHGPAKVWVNLACAFASVLWVHGFRKRRDEKERQPASIASDRPSGGHVGKVMTWSDVPEHLVE